MSARIAPEPIQANVAGLGARPSLFDSMSKAASQPEPAKPTATAESTAPTGLAPLPAPPAPPGSVFAVALISGQLSPKPTSEREILQRLGSAKLPAQGSLALRDLVV
jgi:hypothetical protein